MNQISTSIPVEGAKPKSVSSLYVLKALLAFVVVTCHSPLVLPWVHIPGFVVELFFAITGYFLYTADLGKVQSRIWKSVKKVIPIIVILQVFYALIRPTSGRLPVNIGGIFSGHSWALITMSRDTFGTCRLCSLGCSSLGDTYGS